MSLVIVCGLGEVGYRVVHLLLDLGEEVAVVALPSREEWVRSVEDRGAKVVIGDARDERVLLDVGLEGATAVIAATHNDSTNIEITLDVKRLFPHIPTIARIVDPLLAKHSVKHLGVHRAIAMTAAGAPTFAAATYGDQVLTEFTIGEERLLAIRVDGPQTLKEEPLVTLSKDGQIVEGGSGQLAAGESAVVVAKAESMAELVPKRHRRHSLLRALTPAGVANFFHSVWKNTSVQLRAVLIVILAVIVVSVLVFDLGMNLSPIDALYFVVTTATTTGYGDISPKDASTWLKLYTCFMMIVSATGLAVLFSIVTDYILTARLMQMVGRHHIPERGHVIVVGVGNVGHRVVEELTRLGSHVVAIDRAEDGEFLSTLRAKVHVLVGDGREQETLHRAGARHAKSIIAATASDAVNLSIGLTAKEINPDIRAVLSITDADFAAKIQSLHEIDAALSPANLAAPMFVGAALHPSTTAAFRLDHHFFVLFEDHKGPVRLAGKQFRLESQALP